MAKFTSYASDKFWKHYDELPAHVQKLADKAFELFKENPNYASMYFKRVGKTQAVYSARITEFYRALRYLGGDKVYWFWIGDHKSYERMIRHV